MPPEYYLCTFIGSISSFDVELNGWLLDVAKLLLELGLINQAHQKCFVFLYGIKTDILPVIQVFKFPVFNTITFVKGLKAYVENWVENYKTRICSPCSIAPITLLLPVFTNYI